MLVSHRKQFIYTKTGKTGGTSIESYFEPSCMPDNEWSFSHARDEYVNSTGIIGYRGNNSKGKKWYNHMSAKEIKVILGNYIWDKYFKFCAIRHPFDKLISEFYFFENSLNKSSLLNLNFFKFRISLLLGGNSNNEIDRFRYWVLKYGYPSDRDKYLIDGKVCIDYFIKYENFKDGIQHVCSILGIDFASEHIRRLKSGIRPSNYSIKDYYDTKTIEIVLERYEFEMELFGYDIPF